MTATTGPDVDRAVRRVREGVCRIDDSRALAAEVEQLRAQRAAVLDLADELQRLGSPVERVAPMLRYAVGGAS